MHLSLRFGRTLPYDLHEYTHSIKFRKSPAANRAFPFGANVTIPLVPLEPVSFLLSPPHCSLLAAERTFLQCSTRDPKSQIPLPESRARWSARGSVPCHHAIIPFRRHGFEASCDLLLRAIPTYCDQRRQSSLDTRYYHVRPFKMGHNQT